MARPQIHYEKTGFAESAAAGGTTRLTAAEIIRRHSEIGKVKAVYLGPETFGDVQLSDVYSQDMLCCVGITHQRKDDVYWADLFASGRDAKALVEDLVDSIGLEAYTDADFFGLSHVEFHRKVVESCKGAERLAVVEGSDFDKILRACIKAQYETRMEKGIAGAQS